MLKDFWYLYFEVTIGNDVKYFLNHRRAKAYYHAHKLESDTACYRGRHLWRGVHAFCMMAKYPAIMPRFHGEAHEMRGWDNN